MPASPGLAPSAVVELPARWPQAGAAGTGDMGATRPVDDVWWRLFGSARLEALIREADQGNSDLRVAWESVHQAELALAQVGAARWPTVSAGLSGSAARSQGEAGSASTSRRTTASLSVSYELDLWGRVAAEVHAGEATLRATRLDLEAARHSVRASVASSYLGWLAAAEQLRVARENLAAARRILTIVEARQRGGLQTALDVAQQRTVVHQREAALIPLSTTLQQSATALALLLGRSPLLPQALGEEGLMQLNVPAVAADLPATLLTRRPDLAAAEARLVAADADVRAARAALLPTLSLSAGGSLATDTLLRLADPSRALSLAGSLAQTLFDAGKRERTVEISLSSRRALVERYAAAVRTALKEVDDGLGNARSAERQEQAQTAVVEQAARSLQLAQRRYEAGAGDLLTVLQAQQTLYAAQDSLVSLRLARLRAAVDLCVALGGGWGTADA